MAERAQGVVKKEVVPSRAILFLWCLTALPFLVYLLNFLLADHDYYRFLGNAVEVIVALTCMLSCLYAFSTWSEHLLLLLGAFAFGGYALSNTFWYMYEIALPATGAFVSIAELGFLGFMLFFIVAFRIEFPRRLCPVSWRIAFGTLFIIITLIVAGIPALFPDALLHSAGFLSLTPALAMFILLLVVIAILMDTALAHGVYRYSLLWYGVCLWSFTLYLYAMREMIGDPLVATLSDLSLPGIDLGLFVISTKQLQDSMSIAGPLIILSLLMIQLGIFSYLNAAEG